MQVYHDLFLVTRIWIQVESDPAKGRGSGWIRNTALYISIFCQFPGGCCGVQVALLHLHQQLQAGPETGMSDIVYLPIYPSIYLFIYLSIYLVSIYISIYLSIYLSIYISIYVQLQAGTKTGVDNKKIPTCMYIILIKLYYYI